jgi:8-oxo-dGTP diphosphatase
MSQSKDFPDAFYRVSMKALIRKDGKFLLGHHVGVDTNHWECFGGGLDFGEQPHEALTREIAEETGMRVISISEQPVCVAPHKIHNRRNMEWYYNFPVFYEVVVDEHTFDPHLQYVEIAWFTIDQLQDLQVFEGELGIKEAFKKL